VILAFHSLMVALVKRSAPHPTRFTVCCSFSSSQAGVEGWLVRHT
jgi:hypothetical protein